MILLREDPPLINASHECFQSGEPSQGFPLTGELPASGNLEAVEPGEFRDPVALLRDAPALNEEILLRAANGCTRDSEVRREFVRKAGEEARGAVADEPGRGPRARVCRSRLGKANGARWRRPPARPC